MWRPQSEYIIGQELVEKLLSTVLPEIKNEFFIFCHNPTAQKDVKKENANKKLHMRQTSSFYGVSQNECVLFDDDVGNVLNTDGLFRSYIVNWRKGFILDSYLLYQIQTKKFHFSSQENNSNSCGPIATAKNIHKINKSKKIEEGEGHNSKKDRKIEILFDERIEQNIEESRLFWKKKGIQHPEIIFPQLLSKNQLSKLPPTLIFGGENELFIDDITSFSQRLLSAQYSISNQNAINLSNSQLTDSVKSITRIGNHGSNEMQSKFIIAENDLHVYPIFWRHPVHRILKPLGMTWLFRILFPHRDKCNKINKMSTAEIKKLNLKTDIKSPENCSKFKIACGDDCVNETLNTVAPIETSPVLISSSPSAFDESALSNSNFDDVVHSNAATEAIQCMAQFILDIRNAN